MPNFTNRFPNWGDSGTSPPNGFQYSGGDQLREDHMDYLWYEVDTLTDNLLNEFERYDSTNNGIVDEAEIAQELDGTADAVSYKGNDIDSNGDGIVNEADSALTYKGQDIDSNGDGIVDEADTTTTYKNQDIDSDGDGTVDEADSALTYKGQDIDSNGDGTVDTADYANDADASTFKGNDIDSDGNGKVNAADSADLLKGNDIDSDGDGVVDEADFASNADTVDGKDAGEFYEPTGNDEFIVETRTSDPSSASVGRLWYRTDLD